MELWYPPADQPQLQEWWSPLVAASRAARLERCPWPIHLDEMMLMGRVDRPSRPAIWIYKHTESRRELYLDATGQAYKFTRTPNGPALGRFVPCDIRTAVWQANLPAYVAPVWYDELRSPERSATEPGPKAEERHPPRDAGGARRHPTRRVPPGRSRGHLTLVAGGQTLAG